MSKSYDECSKIMDDLHDDFPKKGIFFAIMSEGRKSNNIDSMLIGKKSDLVECILNSMFNDSGMADVIIDAAGLYAMMELNGDLDKVRKEKSKN